MFFCGIFLYLKESSNPCSMPDLKGVVNFHPILSTNCLKKSISNSGIMRFTFCNVAVFIINHFLLNNSAKYI